MSSPIIAIDGYSSSGKSTLAKTIARELGFVYIDSGAMYRAVALYGLENGILNGNEIDLIKLVHSLPLIHIEFLPDPDTGIQVTLLNGLHVEEKIRGIAVSEVVSKISQVKEVREKMVSLQRKLAEKGGVVMDGRDIGTAVFPDANMKIFMNAGAQVRARRRYNELVQKGVRVNYEEVLANINMRDHEDETRRISPLRIASDALILDNSNMSLEEEMEWFREQWKRIQGK
jgi:cytidylate kinase